VYQGERDFVLESIVLLFVVVKSDLLGFEQLNVEICTF